MAGKKKEITVSSETTWPIPDAVWQRLQLIRVEIHPDKLTA